MNVLEVNDLKTYFFTRWGVVKAVDGATFALGQGETLGLVGESGCGKSTVALSILRLLPRPVGRILSGQILLEGQDIVRLSEREMQKVRGRKISIILQDPMTSLNPVFAIREQITETLRAHQQCAKPGILQRAKDLLGQVRIPSPEERLSNYPHQLSGGMRQRVVGAIALSCQPRVLIADEPTTSLDVTIQAQYLKLLKEIQRTFSLAILFITHDFGIVARMCDRVAVMYAGKIVETAGVREVFNNARHPYTVALLKSAPRLDVRVDKLPSIEGQPPALHRLPLGCSFAPRCESASSRCRDLPPTVALHNGHWVRCWQYA